jgi:Na+-driven multidrug efflux pump
MQSGCVVAFVFGGMMIALQRVLPRIFTNDDDVIDVCADHMPLVALDFILSAFTYIVQGMHAHF